MAGASADGKVNHWPASVDVLTTVIMVVTFLLVIMSAAVMQPRSLARQAHPLSSPCAMRRRALRLPN